MSKEKAIDVVTTIKNAEKEVAGAVEKSHKEQEKKIREARQEVVGSFQERRKELNENEKKQLEKENKKLDAEISELVAEGKRKQEEVIAAAKMKTAKAVEETVKRVLA